jgi:ferredoxin
MLKLKIDGQEIDVAEGATVLDAAREAGATIPTLCHLPGYRHNTSCMVCLVKETRSGQFLPSCSSLAREGMEVDTRGDEVLAARKGALDLLLGEHVGDCDALCQRVCPVRMNIPRLLRFVAAEDWTAAGELVAEARPPCVTADDCAAPCERVCRRGQIDAAVSIRLVVRSAWVQASGSAALPETTESAASAEPPQMERNVSVMPKFREEEKGEMLKGANPDPRTEPAAAELGYTAQEAVAAAARCLHCDCRKADTCLLRRYAVEYDGDQKRYRGKDRVSFERITQHADVIYEPGKCIKCGICVRITEAAGEPLGLTFIGRGFSMRVAVPFEESMAKGLQEVAAKCVAACPTGALANPKV